MSLNTTLICVSFCTKLFRKMKHTFLSNLKNKTRKELTKIEIRRRFRYCYIREKNGNVHVDDTCDKSKYWCKCYFCNKVFQFNTANIWRGDFHQGCKLQKRDKMLMYDDELLQSIVKSHSIRLTYTGNLNRETKMTGNCVVQNCSNTFTRSFREIYNNNSPKLTCKGCTKIKANKLFKETFLHLHGVESPMHVDSFKLKQEKTIMKNHGVTNISQSDVIKSKKIQTCLQNYGVENPSQCDEIQQKKVETCIEKYGVEHYAKTDEFNERVKQTCLERFGVENYTKTDECKERVKETCLERYGVDHYSKTDESKERIKDTCVERYGVENYSKTDECKERIKETCVERYGCENPMYNAEIAEKCANTGFHAKTYTFNSGETCQVQGYEPFALDLLENKHGLCKNDIVTSKVYVPEIWYMDTNLFKIRRYYVDVYLPKQNKMIEVKSTWTYKINSAEIEWKKNACRLYGYEFEVWVFNSKHELIHSE